MHGMTGKRNERLQLGLDLPTVNGGVLCAYHVALHLSSLSNQRTQTAGTQAK